MKIVQRYATYNQADLGDALSLLATNIEDSLIQGGAKAGIDYKILDLYQLAMQYLVAPLDEQKKLGQSFNAEYPWS